MKPIITRMNLGPPIGLPKDGIAGTLVHIPGIVTVAGPNGAGKSRLLRRVAKFPEHSIVSITHAEALRDAKMRWEDICHNRHPIDARGRNRAKIRFEFLESFEWSGKFENQPTVIQLESAAPGFTEAEQVPVGDLRAASKDRAQLSYLCGGSNRSILRIQAIADEYHDSLNPNTNIDSEERDRRQLRFEQLDGLIHELIGTSISVCGIHDARLFGRPMKVADFSLGQRRLISFGAALFESEDSGAPSIIIMDEPETHLHPEAVIHVLDRIEAVAKNSQIWIATHSLPLLASLDPSCIWCMKNGEVFYAGNKTEDVLLSLMGGKNNIDRLADFLSQPAEFALNTFATECLITPLPVQGIRNDPQMNQIAQAISGLPADPLQLLDWGAGKGRLAKTLRQLFADGQKPPSPIDYVAYERDLAYQDDCLDAMDGLVADPAASHITSFSALSCRFAGNPADVIVMCNVLHEVNPLEWTKLMKSEIASVLSDNGHVLIVEDTVMPHGELAHEQGFLVLDEIGIGRLFNDEQRKGIVVSHSADSRFGKRLVACLIPRSLVANVTPATVHHACQWQRDHSKRRIAEIRQDPLKDHGNGRELAFHLVQFANASLMLESLGMDSLAGPTDQQLDAIYETMSERCSHGRSIT